MTDTFLFINHHFLFSINNFQIIESKGLLGSGVTVPLIGIFSPNKLFGILLFRLIIPC